KNIVEIGTSVGYSTIWLAMVSKSLGGKVTSFETDPKKVDLAEKHLKIAGLSDFVTILNVNPITNKDDIPEGIDLVFLDAEKGDYVDHFNAVYEKLNDGGIVVADNIVSHFADLREYIELVRNHDNCSSAMMSSIGRGYELTYKFLPDELQKAPWKVIIR
ncbi:MAG: O-methyltransferase, partial [Candidatus Kariarchaeaceae archaeon]